ncbi:hypothetical protein ABZS98_38125, partial [Streptomyces avermitilis]
PPDGPGSARLITTSHRPYSPNGKGRLARSVGEQSTRSTTDHVVQSFDNPHDEPVINAVQQVAETRGVTMAQVALA